VSTIADRIDALPEWPSKPFLRSVSDVAGRDVPLFDSDATQELIAALRARLDLAVSVMRDPSASPDDVAAVVAACGEGA
jgi:hypothetical protein